MLGAMVSIFSIFLGPLRRSVQDSVFQVFFFFLINQALKVIVTIKSSGCLQIGFGVLLKSFLSQTQR